MGAVAVKKSTGDYAGRRFPAMQDQREKRRQRQHDSKPDGRVAGKDSCERCAAGRAGHLREAKQGCGGAGLVAEWR